MKPFPSTSGRPTRGHNGAHRRIQIRAALAILAAGLFLVSALAAANVSAAGDPTAHPSGPGSAGSRLGLAVDGGIGTFPIVTHADAPILVDPPTVYGYDARTYHLGGFDPLHAYVNNLNGDDAQVPTLMSSAGQPAGIYFVGNATGSCPSGELPFLMLDLGSGAPRQVSCIYPLYAYGYTEMLGNEFYIEYGYDVALFFGTRGDGGGTYSIELVNLTTGQMTLWNTRGTISTTNQQPDYVGNNTVIVFTDNNTAWGWNLASHQSWLASSDIDGTGWSAPVEANNIYWLPQRSQFINVEAHHDTKDRVVQLNATYTAGRMHLSKAATITVDTNHTVFNFVNGLDYNASYGADGALAFTAGYFEGGTVYTYVVPYSATGLLTTTGIDREPVYNSEGNIISADVLEEERYVYTSDDSLGWYENGQQYLYDPWTNVTLPANLSFYDDIPFGNAAFEGTYAPSPNYLIDFRATLLLNSPDMYDVVYAYLNGSSPYPLSPPDAPTDLSVVTVSPSQVDLSWVQPPGPVTDDHVYVYNGSVCSGSPTSVDLDSAAVVYNDTGLQGSAAHSFTVTASNSTGEGLASACANSVPTHVPPAPTDLVATVRSGTTIALTWANPPGFLTDNTAYVYDGAGCSGTARSTDLDGIVTAYAETNLSMDTQYSFTVTASNTTGMSAPSNCASAQTFGVPAAPTGLVVTTQSDTVISLSWHDPPGALVNNHVLWYDGATCAGTTTSIDLGSPVTGYQVTYLGINGSYSFQVTASNSTGTSAPSACVPGQTFGPPGAPQDLGATNVSDVQINLTWVDPPGPLVNLTVFIWANLTCSGGSTPVSLDGVFAAWSDRGLTPMTDYSYRVMAWNSTGPSPLSNCASNITQSDNTLVPPWVSNGNLWWAVAVLCALTVAATALYFWTKRRG
ncbi:MAG: fibronectin type III domain-containing protein [Thermoplasmata archaeon]